MSNPVPSPIRDATSTRRGLMGITAQTFSGVKTFLDAIKLALKTTATLPAGGPELEGSMVYDSTTKRAQVHDGTSWVPVVMATSGTGSITLEEHIASVNAHPSDHIEFSGGVTGWANGTTYAPTDMNDAVLDIVDKLAAPDGAAKLGTTPGGGLVGTNVQAQLNELGSNKVSRITVGSAWVDLTPYVYVSEGWVAGTGMNTPKAIIRGDKVVYAGTVTRAAADRFKQVPFTGMPVQFRGAVNQGQFRTLGGFVPALTPGYVILLASGPSAGDPNFYIWNEPSTSYANLTLYLNGLEFYLNMGLL